MEESESDPDEDLRDKLTERDRVECRAFARVFSTADGKILLESIKRDIGWDEAGPIDRDTENPIIFWTGQRSVIWGIMHKISMGKRLSS